jgi:hypothetical protein
LQIELFLNGTLIRFDELPIATESNGRRARPSRDPAGEEALSASASVIQIPDRLVPILNET